MRRTLASLLVLGLSALPVVGLIGCSGEEASVESQQTIETPQGSTTVTTEKTIETEGENPPVPVPGGENATTPAP